MVRFLTAAAALLAMAGPASAQIIGNTLQAAVDLRIMACANGGRCMSQSTAIAGINIYFSKDRKAYVYGRGQTVREAPLGRYVANAKGSQQGIFLSGNRIDFKVATAGVLVGLSFRVTGRNCTIAGLAASSAQHAVILGVTPKYCRMVQGRVAPS